MRLNKFTRFSLRTSIYRNSEYLGLTVDKNLLNHNEYVPRRVQGLVMGLVMGGGGED